jgi:RimJ/RimL family protein N-acetyltransferase
MIMIRTPRLQLSPFQMSDAKEVFACTSPAVTRFMSWEPPTWNEYIERCEKREQTPDPNSFLFVIRRVENNECFGMCALEDADTDMPEIGLWMKETVHGQGFGREVVTALAEWGFKTFDKEGFIYPVAVQNTASRRIAEAFGGKIIDTRTNPKYESVVYKIPRKS